MNVEVKLCGMNNADAVACAVAAGADYLGFVFYEPSPRHLDYDAALRLTAAIPAHIRKVALMVDADDARIGKIIAAIAPDILQAHGGESPERIAQITKKFKLPVWKAVPVSSAADIAAANAYTGIAERVLFDAKPPKTMAKALPGGNALSFDWKLLAQSSIKNFVLAGGLTAENVAVAVRVTNAAILDASSSLEISPGVKDNHKIESFIKAVKAIKQEK